MTPLALTVMMYHYVRDPGDEAEAGSGVPGLRTATFAAQLDELARRHEMVAWPNLADHLSGGKSLPSRACLLTFDDGLRDHYLNVFPALRARNLSGLFFAMARQPGDGLALPYKIHFLLAQQGVDDLRQTIRDRLPPDGQQALDEANMRYRAEWDTEEDAFKTAIQRDLSPTVAPVLSGLLTEQVGPEAVVADSLFLTPAQVTEMAAGGMHFGGHSQSHPWLDWLPPAAQRAEIDASLAWVRQVQPGPCAFAYPYGGYGPETPGIVQAGGFAAAFTTAPQITHSDPYLIGRLDGESRFAWLTDDDRESLASAET